MKPNLSLQCKGFLRPQQLALLPHSLLHPKQHQNNKTSTTMTLDHSPFLNSLSRFSPISPRRLKKYSQYLVAARNGALSVTSNLIAVYILHTPDRHWPLTLCCLPPVASIALSLAHFSTLPLPPNALSSPKTIPPPFFRSVSLPQLNHLNLGSSPTTEFRRLPT